MATTDVRSPSLADVQEMYDRATDPDVVAFITQHPGLIPLLHRGRLEIDRHFGENSRVFLEVRTDPEDGDSALFARIVTDLPDRDATERLYLLWDEWWLDALRTADGRMHFDVWPA